MKWTSWLALVVLVLLGGFIVWSSLSVGGIRCEVCIDFNGGRACRSVDAASEAEALAGARTNACARLASGVTQTMACERAPTASTSCRPL
jgi:hypothetical protein